MNKNKNLAFTLAEVLIVIGIIGVVAALTLPNLNHATGDKERVTKVKKIYGALTEAFDRAQAIYGDYNTWFKDLSTNEEKSKRAGKRITEFMKISKDCGLEINQGCFSSGSTHLLGNPDSSYFSYDNNDTLYKAVLGDGMSIGIEYYSDNFTIIEVDIDGPNKGSYTYGKDIFSFDINGDSILSPYKNGPGGPSYNFVQQGTTASYWIITFDNADYLKADSDGKCNDSDIILSNVGLGYTTNTSCH